MSRHGEARGVSVASVTSFSGLGRRCPNSVGKSRRQGSSRAPSSSPWNSARSSGSPASAKTSARDLSSDERHARPRRTPLHPAPPRHGASGPSQNSLSRTCSTCIPRSSVTKFTHRFLCMAVSFQQFCMWKYVFLLQTLEHKPKSKEIARCHMRRRRGEKAGRRPSQTLFASACLLVYVHLQKLLNPKHSAQIAWRGVQMHRQAGTPPQAQASAPWASATMRLFEL